MKLTLNWLKQYIDFDWSPDELAERLTMLGLEVEGVQKLAGEFEGIVVAQVITRDKHPNADKLTVCRVHDGKGERQIVCGAQNFKPGDKVPLIQPGASLPAKPGEQPFTVKVGKIRGVESFGMMCSGRELGLSDDHEGLFILREDAKVGQPFAEYLGRAAGDVVYDLETTPNRPDWNSLIGIAREIAALTGRPLKLPELTVATGPMSVVGADPHTLIDHWVAVKVYEPELCPRYTARVVRGVKVGPSPDWLRGTLEKVGVRSINNVVDVTNYVMLEVGQPLHAFDYHLLQGIDGGQPAIVVRRASEGERFTTLDGVARTLTNEMLLIADENKGIALAGIMGGQNTEINETTRDVLIESASFKPTNIRRTSKALSLRSESSYRFERGCDPNIVDWASRRAAQLILQTAGGELVPGVVDAYPQPIEPRQVSLRHAKVGQLLGVEISAADNVRHLTALGLEVVGQSNDACTFRVPTFRVDLKRETDLIEEILRLHGVEKVPATPPRGAIGANPFDAVYDEISEARRILTGLGLSEAQGQTLVANDECRISNVESVKLANPLSSDMDLLRPSLLPGLLNILRQNISRKNYDVALFEIGRVFSRVQGQTREQQRVAIALTGQRHAPFWSGEGREARFDIYDLKGTVEEFLDQFGLRGIVYARQPESTALFLESASITLGGRHALGELGQLLPALAKRYDLRDAVLLAELDLDQLLARRNTSRSFKPLPACPAIRRDVAMFIPEATTHEAVLNVVKQAKPAHLENVELFDVFRGRNVPPGQKSVAYAFTYRSSERTLTDAEVNTAHEKLVAQFKHALGATVREA
jgi:phenylalanyl-tRNA synthetase beta chain